MWELNWKRKSQQAWGHCRETVPRREVPSEWSGRMVRPLRHNIAGTEEHGPTYPNCCHCLWARMWFYPSASFGWTCLTSGKGLFPPSWFLEPAAGGTLWSPGRTPSRFRLCPVGSWSQPPTLPYSAVGRPWASHSCSRWGRVDRRRHVRRARE